MFRFSLLCVALFGLVNFCGATEVKSVKSGNWSDPSVWEAAKIPSSGDEVLVSQGTNIVYDVESDDVIRSIRVSGKLSFARDRNTLLNVGLITVVPDGGRDPNTVQDVHDEDSEKGDLHRHQKPHQSNSHAIFAVGTQSNPIPHPHSARIRLHYLDGMNKDNAPAIVCRPGGRLTFSGDPLNRTWVELGKTAKPETQTIKLERVVTGWREGDEILVTGSFKKYGKDKRNYDHQIVDTEKRIIQRIDGDTIVLNKALKHEHFGEGKFRSEVANLTRNVVVESADPDGVRGHTMFHRYSSGGIYYAQFSKLGKHNTLGRYPIHFHMARDSMRGSAVIGASIVDSQNRWVTIHSTQYLVVRDCVGFQSVGHGFFLEDGMEVYNVLDRNLGVQAMKGPRMKGQALPFDPNDGAAYWWANGRNTFVRNVACENFRYGYRYDSQKRSNFDSHLKVRSAEGTYDKVDIRTLPIYRFQDNESHSEGLYSMAFAGTDGVGPDTQHPHRLKNLTIWQTHYALRAQIPTMLIENVDIEHAAYGVYRPWFENHVYRDIRISDTGTEPFNRGLDDKSEQHGRITVDGLTFDNMGYGGGRMPLIQLSDNNLSGTAESHFRNVNVIRSKDGKHRWPLFNRGGGRVVEPKTPNGVPVFLHDHFGTGRHAKIVSVKARDLLDDENDYRQERGLTGPDSRVTEVANIEFPKLLNPIDDQPPATIITSPSQSMVQLQNGRLVVRGTTTDNAQTSRVFVNGIEATNIDYNFHRWQVELTGLKQGRLSIKAYAVDATGNREKTPHVLNLMLK